MRKNKTIFGEFFLQQKCYVKKQNARLVKVEVVISI